ncbi:MAG TPA: hypothetical protein V6C58_03900 [Allocoleopsis sp.]
MSKIRLYMDEDAMDNLFVQAIRTRDVDVNTVKEIQKIGISDEEQLIIAPRPSNIHL